MPTLATRPALYSVVFNACTSAFWGYYPTLQPLDLRAVKLATPLTLRGYTYPSLMEVAMAMREPATAGPAPTTQTALLPVSKPQDPQATGAGADRHAGHRTHPR